MIDYAFLNSDAPSRTQSMKPSTLRILVFTLCILIGTLFFSFGGPLWDVFVIGISPILLAVTWLTELELGRKSTAGFSIENRRTSSSASVHRKLDSQPPPDSVGGR